MGVVLHEPIPFHAGNLSGLIFYSICTCIPSHYELMCLISTSIKYCIFADVHCLWLLDPFCLPTSTMTPYPINTLMSQCIYLDRRTPQSLSLLVDWWLVSIEHQYPRLTILQG